jgi:hypothetical protein
MNGDYEVLAPLRAIAAHLERHELPAPVGVDVRAFGRPVVVQLHQVGLRSASGALLVWARTLADVTVEAWRVPSGDSVHLTVAGRLLAGLLVHVYDAVDFDSATFPDMAEDAKLGMPLRVLHVWAGAGEVAV